jgi:hypothetical protein
MDITRQLYDAENSLRDYVDIVMSAKHGADWIVELKKVNELVDSWEIRRIPEELSHNAIKGSEKSIHYASIEELRSILKTHWNGDFQSTFGDHDILDVYLRIIDDYRNPNSRRRELFVHQKHLLLGIAGDIRSKIALARSRNEAGEEGFPRVESVRDNRGNLWTPGMPRKIKSQMQVSVGEELEFIVTATDPLGSDLSYRLHGGKWQPNNVILQKVTPSMVGRNSLFHITIKSGRKYHANKMGFDDKVAFEYEVVPKST